MSANALPFALPVAVLAVLGLGAAPLPPTQPAGAGAMAEFRALCMDWDADPEMTQDLAVERGYAPAQDRVAGFTPRGRAQEHVFAWTRTVDGVELQVTIKPRGFIGFGPGETLRVYHDQCALTVRPGRRSEIRSGVARELGQDSFRQGNTSVFAWIPTPGGRRPVSRRRFEGRLYRLMSEEGMRMITVSDHRDQVVVSYFAPARENCRVRPEYSADVPNIDCAFPVAPEG